MNDSNIGTLIDDFLSEGPYAVVGASSNRDKYGNKVFRAYVQSGREAWPVHPTEAEIEGHPAFATLADLPSVPRAISIITPPAVTEKVVEAAGNLGVRFVWMQPGAESPRAIEIARSKGMGVIADGSCLLVVVGYHGD